MNRREFLRNACAAAAAYGLPARIWGAAKMMDAPDLVIGLLSDIHIGLHPKDDPVKATSLFRHALEYFRDRHVDGVLVSGDLTNSGLEPEAKVTVAERIGRDRRGRETVQVVVTFPTVRSSSSCPRAYEYFVRVERLDGACVREKRVYSPGINLPEGKDAMASTCVFAKSEIAGRGPLRFVVRPANCWGVCGCSIVAESNV